MTEPTFSFTPKLAGDFFTVRGNTIEEFHSNIAAAATNAALLTDLALLQGALNAAVLTAAQQPVQPVPAPPAPQYAQPQAPPQPQYQQPQQQYAPAPPQGQPQFVQQQPQYVQPQGHICECGLEMKLRNSQYGSFYSCAKAQGDPSRCQKKINV